MNNRVYLKVRRANRKLKYNEPSFFDHKPLKIHRLSCFQFLPKLVLSKVPYHKKGDPCKDLSSLFVDSRNSDLRGLVADSRDQYENKLQRKIELSISLKSFSDTCHRVQQTPIWYLSVLPFQNHPSLDLKEGSINP